MKKNITLFFISLAFALSAIVTIKSSMSVSEMTKLLVMDGIEALAYSNEGPGPQGQRHTQAVWCGGGGWDIAVGCCYGWENCSIVNCPNHSFSCNGIDWITF